MRHKRTFAIFVLLATASLLANSNRTLFAEDVADAETIKLEQEVDALSALNDLNLSPEQLSALKGMISDTAGTLSDPPTRISAEYKAALKELRTALLSKDQNKIDNAEDKTSDLEDKQDPDSDADVDQSEPAKQKAATLLRMLSPKQVANYIGENSDDVDDPAQLLLDAVHHACGMSDDDFDSLQDDTSERIGILFGGAHPAKPPAVVGKVTRLLARVHHLSADEYKSQQSTLEDEARQLVGEADPIPCLRHWMENEMADLLSNPQLGQALTDLGVTTAK